MRILIKLLILLVVLLVWSGALAAQLRQVAMLDLPGQPGFDSIAFANGKLVIAHAGANTVEIFDPVRRRLLARVNNMSQPRGIAVDEEGSRVYVANAGNNTITVINSQSWQVEGNLPVPASPGALLWAPQAARLYCSNWHDGSISVLDPKGGSPTTVSLDGRPEDMAFDPARKVLLVSLQDRNEVAVLSPDLGVVARYPLAGSQPTGIAVDSKNRKMFVAVRYAVLVLDLDSGKELGRIPAGAGADRVWYDDISQTIYAAAGGGAVSLIRSDGGKYVAEQELATDVRGHTLAFDAAHKLVYVPGGREGRSKLIILKATDNAPPTRAQSASATLR